MEQIGFSECIALKGLEYPGYSDKMVKKICKGFDLIVVGDSEALAKEGIFLEVDEQKKKDYPYISDLNISALEKLGEVVSMSWSAFDVHGKLKMDDVMKGINYYTGNCFENYRNQR